MEMPSAAALVFVVVDGAVAGMFLAVCPPEQARRRGGSRFIFS